MDWVDMPFNEALAYLRGLRPMTDRQFAAIEREAAARAFTVARITKLDALQAILDELNDGLKMGLTLEEFLSDVDGIVDGALTDARIAQVYQTNIQTAYGAGKWLQGSDPDIVDEIFGWKYVTVGDDRVREEHAALDGMIFAVGEGDAVFPPWDFGCRCSAEWVLKSEMEPNAQLDPIPDEVKRALADSDFSSPALQVAYRPDLSGVHPSLVSDYLNDSNLSQ